MPMLRILTVSMLLALAATAAAETSAPGLLLDVGGYRLHIACEGYGTPTVVFDVGLGGSALEWRAVVDEVRAFTRVCTYDRAGYGWSDPGPLPRTSSVIVNELYLLLSALDLDTSFILAGHSYGGYNMQLFARRYPYLVSGLVLVDSSHPTQVERFLAPPIRLNTAPSSGWGMVKFGSPPEPHPSLPEATRRLMNEQTARWKTRRTLAQEFLGFRDSAREVRTAQALISMPVVVISRGKRVWPRGPRGNLMEHLWMKMHSELANLSPWSAHIVARRSGHQVQLEQPQLIAYAIAVLTDIHRAQHAADVDGERQELTDKSRLDFRAAAWLGDTLVDEPEAVEPVAAVSQTSN